MNECFCHSRPSLERLEIGIKPIALHTKHMIWLPTMGGTGHPIARNDLHMEDPETTGMDSDNYSISGLDATVALGRLEAEGHPDDLIHRNQAKLTALMREKDNLHQWAEIREGQPAAILDHIE